MGSAQSQGANGDAPPENEPIASSISVSPDPVPSISVNAPPPGAAASPRRKRAGPAITARPSGPLKYFTKAIFNLPDLAHDHSRPDPYDPTPEDVLETHGLLCRKGLPPELVPRILDFAEYWSVCSRELSRDISVAAGSVPPRKRAGPTGKWTSGQEEDLRELLELEGSGLEDDEGETWYLVSEEIGCGYNLEDGEDLGTQGAKEEEEIKEKQAEEENTTRSWLRRIVVKTLSKDQGWSSSDAEHYGTYRQSYTWFELSLLRDGKEVEGSRVDFQHNVHAGQYYKEHGNSFDEDHKLVKMARPGDRIVLWVRAQYPGWCNNLRKASITVFSSPFPSSSH